MIDYELVHDLENEQYVFHVGDYVADLQYEAIGENILKLTHVGVPSQLEGRGVASQLVEKSLIDIESRGLSIIPVCPFIVAYIERHPDWQRIVVQQAPWK